MKNLKEIKKLKIAMLEQNFKKANSDNQWLKNNDGALFTENNMLHWNINYHGMEAKIKK